MVQKTQPTHICQPSDCAKTINNIFLITNTDLTILQVKFVDTHVSSRIPRFCGGEGPPSSYTSVGKVHPPSSYTSTTKIHCQRIADKLIKRFACVLQ